MTEMTQTIPMYCAEQIIIPEKFPNMLKTYAKGIYTSYKIFVAFQSFIKSHMNFKSGNSNAAIRFIAMVRGLFPLLGSECSATG